MVFNNVAKSKTSFFLDKYCNVYANCSADECKEKVGKTCHVGEICGSPSVDKEDKCIGKDREEKVSCFFLGEETVPVLGFHE